MDVKKIIPGVLVLLVTIPVLIALMPLILFCGLLSLITGKRMFIHHSMFSGNSGGENGFPRQKKGSDDDGVIDVEVISSENVGEKDDLSGRSLE